MRGPLVLHHPWLGDVFQYSDDVTQGALIGFVSIDPAIRRPANDGDTRAEVLLQLGPVLLGPDLDVQLASVTGRIQAALTGLAQIRAYGVQHAPAAWRAQNLAHEEQPLVERLWLMGFEVNPSLEMAVTFDFADLDTLVVHLDPSGRARRVEIRP